MAVGLVGERDAVVRPGQELAQRAEGRPVDVVAHVLAQHVAPVALGDDVLRVGDRQRRDALDREAALVVLGGIRLVERLGRHLGRGRLVRPDLLRVPAGGLGRALHHDVAADEVVVVAEAVGKLAAGRVQQQPRRLDRVAGDGDDASALAVLDAVVEVGDAGGAPMPVDERRG